MGERRDIYELKELSKISCICTCGTEIIIDVDMIARFSDCPSCGSPLYPLHEILLAYAEIHKKATDAKLRIRLASPPRSNSDTAS